MPSDSSATPEAAKLLIADLKRTASLRPAGFVDAVLARGKIEGDFVLLDDAAVDELLEKFPDPSVRPPEPPPAALQRPPRKFHLSKLKVAAAKMPAGFLEAFLDRGTVDGNTVTLEESAFLELRAKFPPPRPSPPPPGASGRFLLANVKAAAPRRPKGYLEFVLSRGKVEGDTVTLDERALREVLEKFPILAMPKLPEPTVAEMATNFAGAMKGWINSGFAVVEREIYEGRHAICLGCEYWDAAARGGLGKCRKCGCSRVKLWLESSKCPLNPPKW
jgi:hypothetical protein